MGESDDIAVGVMMARRQRKSAKAWAIISVRKVRGGVGGEIAGYAGLVELWGNTKHGGGVGGVGLEGAVR